ncbi:ParB/RepB/Spo0J family partition protein [Streptomyces sp. BE147]|uniref:ParB/RepB/Spo0J family partition protein n=1 Tax=Streptomyces sp. BE147 TaxID=3002524 RepID=UPI002E7A1A0E|nr:ParB/RepB/Spo0J family partition protein [Streptomyces sp. BE147]MEE1735434.1 ParB/RepB/Spo0J family partition protein [Streptomyces sp. BE147]
MAGAQNDGLSLKERRRRLAEQRAREEAAANPQGGPVNGVAATPEVPLRALVHNPRNARRNMEGVEGLADTYEAAGVLQPCLVIPVETYRAAFPEDAVELPETGYVVIGGNRRLAAAHRAGLATLPVHVNIKLKTRVEILVAAATENIAREELKPFEELDTIEELKAELGTYDAVAKKLGKSGGWVSQRRRLRHLQPEVRQALETRAPGMTIELARDLGKITERDEQLKAWRAAQRATQLATNPAPQKKSKKSSKVPAQGGSGGGSGTPLEDPAAKARREACVLAVAAGAGDLARLSIIAAKAPVSADDAVALAGQWLTETAVGSSVLNVASLPGDEGTDRQKQGALALALAHCELHLTRSTDTDSTHARAYADWLESHTDYQPIDAEPATA